MIHDLLCQFSAAQAITATALSTNIIDLGLNRNIGVGEDLYVGVVVVTAFTDAGSDSTVAVTLVGGSTTTPATVRMTLGTFAALSAVGASFVAKLQPNVVIDRYIGLNYTVANGNLTTGALTSFLTHDLDAFQAYASGFLVQ